MPKLIYERAIKRDPETGELVSYWPEYWPLSTLLNKLVENGSPFFAASYMNDPSALQGNSLKVSWLRFYLESELEAARLAAGVTHGMRYVGFDPTMGGKSTDPDFFAAVCLEIIQNRGYLIDFYFDRKPVDVQAQLVEDWADIWQPDMILVEDTAEQGYVWTAMTSQINGGRGSKYPVQSRQPQSTRNLGGKQMRLQAMGARFQNGQVRIPGIVNTADEVRYDPRWEALVNQWRTFPSGHDDILDAIYWACSDAFMDVEAASAFQDSLPPMPTSEDHPGRFHKTKSRTVQQLERMVEPELEDNPDPRQPIGTPYRDRGLMRRMLRPENDGFFTH